MLKMMKCDTTLETIYAHLHTQSQSHAQWDKARASKDIMNMFTLHHHHLLLLLLFCLRKPDESGCTHQGQTQQTHTDHKDVAVTMLEHIFMKKHQHTTWNKVEGNSEPVCDWVAISIWDHSQPEVPHCREIDSNTELEGEKSDEGCIGARAFGMSWEHTDQVWEKCQSYSDSQHDGCWDSFGW